MKRTTILNLFVAGAILLSGATACKKKPTGTTTIPGQKSGFIPGGPSGPENGGILPGTGDAFSRTPEGIPLVGHESIEGRPQDRSKFSADTVYFDLDSSSVKGGEKSKLEDIANYFKSNPTGDLLIEGHCDERGTEGYNLALGDKRANSLREYLVNLGVPAERVQTVSFGEAKPAVEGHNDAAWSKNRRGEFVFVEPAQ